MLLGFQLRVSVLGLVIWSSRGSIGYIGVTRFPVEAEVEISKKGCPSSLMVIQDLGGHEVLEVSAQPTLGGLGVEPLTGF